MTGLEAAFEQAKTITFEFLDVLEDRIEVAALDRFLAASDVAPFTRYAQELLLADEMYVITSVLKTDRIAVRASSRDRRSVDVDLPVIQDVVGGNVQVSRTGEKTRHLTYRGKTPLVFGFQAVQVFFEDGEYRAIPTAAGLTLRGTLPDMPEDGSVRLAASAPLVRLGTFVDV